MAAIGAADAGRAVLEIAALEEVSNGFVVDRPPVAELAGVTLGVNVTEGVEVFADESMEVGFERLARAIDARNPRNDPRLQSRNDADGFGALAGQGGPLSAMGWTPPCVGSVRVVLGTCYRWPVRECK